MRILIVGAGAVGQTLARQLSEERHLVTVVDNNPELAGILEDRVDAMVVIGNGGSAAVLEQAGVRDTDLLLAVTSADEVNILACMVAMHFGVKTKIARIRNLDYVRDLAEIHGTRLPLELVINPEGETATEIARVLRVPVARYVAEFAEGRLKLIGFRVRQGAPIAHIPLEELRAELVGHSFVVCAIARGDQVIIPRGDARMQPGDDVFVMVRSDAEYVVPRLAGRRDVERLARVLVLGGSRIGVNLAQDLEDTGVDVTVIDSNPERCERLTSRLPHVLVVLGDGTDPDLLAELGVGDADAFVATSGDDETNILASAQAKRMGCDKVVAVVRKAQYGTLIATTGLADVAVNPNTVTADAITRYVREGRVVSLASLGAVKADVVEYVAQENSAVVGAPIRDLQLPKGVVIAAILSGGQVFTPSGGDVIRENDRVIVAFDETVQDQVDAFFGRRGWFR